MSSNEINSPSWKTWSAAIGAIAVFFIILVGSLTLESRAAIRQQILDRDGHVLTGVARMLQSAGDLGFPPSNLEIAALQTSRLRGVLAVRLFYPDGDFNVSFPVEVSEGKLAAADRKILAEGKPVARFHPNADLEKIFYLLPKAWAAEHPPLQEVLIPLYEKEGGEIAGFAEYLIDGEPVQAEFAALDRTLLLQVGTALGLGLAGLFLLAAVAFARLRRSHQALANQTIRLMKANKELSLAARTSAIGAVTAHLIHGIRNPLTGLDLFFQTRNTAELPGQSPESWRQLADATYKIRDLVDDVVEVLREQDSTTSFLLTLEELEAVLQEKLLPKACAAGVRFETRRFGDGELPGHAANLLLLILMNLVDNALSLTPKDKAVWVRVERRDDHIAFEVGDEGPGIPPEIQPHLFTPGKTGRPGGTGLGLAISHRLAANLNASLQLARSDDSGTVFSLLYPLEEEAMEALPEANGSLERETPPG